MDEILSLLPTATFNEITVNIIVSVLCAIIGAMLEAKYKFITRINNSISHTKVNKGQQAVGDGPIQAQATGGDVVLGDKFVGGGLSIDAGLLSTQDLSSKSKYISTSMQDYRGDKGSSHTDTITSERTRAEVYLRGKSYKEAANTYVWVFRKTFEMIEVDLGDVKLREVEALIGNIIKCAESDHQDPSDYIDKLDEVLYEFFRKKPWIS